MRSLWRCSSSVSMALLTIGSVGLTAALAPVNASANAVAAAQLADGDQIVLGQPIYGGSGCLQGTASATLSPDAKSLSILFDQFSAEAGGSTMKRSDRKACNVAIPVHIPHGLSVSVLQIDYRGFNSIPMGATADFSVEYFFAGSRGPSYSAHATGPVSRDFTITNKLLAQATVWSPCGMDVNLRTNANLRVMTNARMDEVSSTIDSADVSAGIIYLLQWKRCDGSAVIPPQNGFGG